MKRKFSFTNYCLAFKTGILYTLLLLLSGCLAVKPAGVKSAANLFETFYVGEEGTQYFIKPLSFYNIENKEEIYIDFTFRFKSEVKDSVMANMSIQSLNLFKSIEGFSISNSASQLLTTDIHLLFNEKKGKFFISRFTTKFSLHDLNELFNDLTWSILITSNQLNNTYIPTKKTKKALKRLQDKVFVLLK